MYTDFYAYVKEQYDVSITAAVHFGIADKSLHNYLFERVKRRVVNVITIKSLWVRLGYIGIYRDISGYFLYMVYMLYMG